MLAHVAQLDAELEVLQTRFSEADRMTWWCALTDQFGQVFGEPYTQDADSASHTVASDGAQSDAVQQVSITAFTDQAKHYLAPDADSTSHTVTSDGGQSDAVQPVSITDQAKHYLAADTSPPAKKRATTPFQRCCSSCCSSRH